MSTIKHTPAPWRIEQEPDLIAIKAFRLDNASDICALPDGKIDQANARLIAAAPDLLEALQGYVAHIESCRAAWEEDGAERNTKMHGLAVALNNILGDRIKEAIAKATGETVMAA
jgi:hypothetical protein